MDPRVRLRSCLGLLAALLLLGLSAGPVAAADGPVRSEESERALAERFAPVVRVVHQAEECGPGEPYRPSDVGLVLGNPSVALRGSWADDELLATGPTAEDLSAGLYGYHLDLPGNPLQAGCDYERWVRSADIRPTIYAHVATEEGEADRLALQYWFFYPYNDYTNKHEADWEMIQLVFGTADPAEAIDQTPLAVGYSQHEGMEVADWGDPKLEIVDDTHPVVYPAAGSHADFFEPALYLGTSAEQGFGCDDARGPSDEVQAALEVIPSDPAAAAAAFPWIAYQGRWGQREESFYNGPTGPNTKTSWTQPISYQEENGREVSFAVPAGGALGTSATDFFCSAVSSGSEVVRKLADNPTRLLLILAGLALVVVFLVRRTTWTPVIPLHIARRRTTGQMIRAAARMYRSHWRTFIGIGLLTIPTSLAAAGVQGLLRSPTHQGLAGLSEGARSGSFEVAIAALLSFLLLGIGILLVLSATTHALGQIDRGAPVGVVRAYGLALARWRPLLGAFLVASALVTVLSLTVVLSPIALLLLLLFALFVPVIAFETRTSVGALRRSSSLVRQQVLKTVVLLASSILLAGAVGPILGTFLILLTGAPFPLANVVAGVTYAVLMPFVGLTMAYLYFDARVRSEVGEPDDTPEVLPAEIELPA